MQKVTPVIRVDCSLLLISSSLVNALRSPSGSGKLEIHALGTASPC